SAGTGGADRGIEAQQGVGEVSTPHHDRVGYGAEQQQMHHQPAGRGDERVDEGGGAGGDQPQQRRQVPQGREPSGPAHGTSLLRPAHVAAPPATSPNSSTPRLSTPPTWAAREDPSASPPSHPTSAPCNGPSGSHSAG